MTVALVALFFSLGGAAVAGTMIVPLAKRALNADKLGGKTRAQVVVEAAAVPGPASSAAGTVVVKSQGATIAGNYAGWHDVACDTGQRAVTGGFEWKGGDELWWYDSFPNSDDSGWRFWLNNESATTASATLYVVCLK